ncbi:MAG: hypothetical protein ABI844_13915, partial [Saprospiraceae bacterium]
MHRLPFIILFIFLSTIGIGQSPHGANFTMECAKCHTSENWKVNPQTIYFRHDSTSFPLTGSHQQVDCKACHESLKFSETDPACITCHQDMHSNTVGNNCVRCHNTNSWQVTNKARMHELAAFPLLGVHGTVECTQCHKSADPLRFDRIGTACINCHQQDYGKKDKIDHTQAGFSTECASCHQMTDLEWKADFNHEFFPLSKGHDLNVCAQCHTSGSYSATSSKCESCHSADYQSAKVPDHSLAKFSTDCASCHTTDPGWKPAEYKEHDSKFFPIYSGKHAGTWNDCTACHTVASNFQKFECIECHQHNKPEMDAGHAQVNGYSYNSTACYTCHPTGDALSGFDHSKTHFPLTGGHIGISCISCHAMGYAGTSTNCIDCHTKDYTSTVNPNHKQINISTDCASCHTTEPGWKPAKFTDHNSIYKLEGSHAGIANDCAACHNGKYDGSTPVTCFGCHSNNFNSTTKPDHKTSNFPTNCASCHNQVAWQPAEFDHNKTNFPLRGAHVSVACISCHANGYTGTPSNCVDCHLTNYNSTTDPNHKTSNFPTNCVSCHSQTAWQPA